MAKTLSIKLTSKTFDKVPHPFCGFPLSQLSKHVSTLVEAGYRVVIVQETAQRSGKMLNRVVTRVVTAGTGFSESFVKGEEMNFVLAVGTPMLADPEEHGDSMEQGDGPPGAKLDVDEQVIGLAYRDISTGASFSRLTTLERLLDDIALIDPKEVVLDTQLAASDEEYLQKVYRALTTYGTRCNKMISTIEGTMDAYSAEDSAVGVLSNYLAQALPQTPPPPSPARRIEPANILQMDANTLESLEIKQSMRGGLRGSLLHTVKRTVTPGGTRLLTERLCKSCITATRAEYT